MPSFPLHQADQGTVSGSIQNATETPTLQSLARSLNAVETSEDKAVVCLVLQQVCSCQDDVQLPQVPAELLKWLWHTAVFDPAASPCAVAAWNSIIALVMASQGTHEAQDPAWLASHALLRHEMKLLTSLAPADSEDATGTSPAHRSQAAQQTQLSAALASDQLGWVPGLEDLESMVAAWGGRRRWLSPCDAVLEAAGVQGIPAPGEHILLTDSASSATLHPAGYVHPKSGHLKPHRSACVGAGLHCLATVLSVAPLRVSVPEAQRCLAMLLRLSCDEAFSGVDLPAFLPFAAQAAAPDGASSGALEAFARESLTAFAGPANPLSTLISVLCITCDEQLFLQEQGVLPGCDVWHGFDASLGSVPAPPRSDTPGSLFSRAELSQQEADKSVSMAFALLRPLLPTHMSHEEQDAVRRHLLTLHASQTADMKISSLACDLCDDSGPSEQGWVHGVCQAAVNFAGLSVQCVRAHLAINAAEAARPALFATAHPADVQGMTLQGFSQYMLKQATNMIGQLVDVWMPAKGHWETHKVLGCRPPGQYTRDTDSAVESFTLHSMVFKVSPLRSMQRWDLNPLEDLVRPTLLPCGDFMPPHTVPAAYLKEECLGHLPEQRPPDDGARKVALRGLAPSEVTELLASSRHEEIPLEYASSVLERAAFNTPETAQSHPGHHSLLQMFSVISSGGFSIEAVDVLRRRLLVAGCISLLTGGDSNPSRKAQEAALQRERGATKRLLEKSKQLADAQSAAGKAGQRTLIGFASVTANRSGSAVGKDGCDASSAPLPAPSLGTQEFEAALQAATEWAAKQVLPVGPLLSSAFMPTPVVLHMPRKVNASSIRTIAALIAVRAPAKPSHTLQMPSGVYGSFYSRVSTLISMVYELSQHLWQREDATQVDPAARSAHISVRPPKQKHIQRLIKVFSDWAGPLRSEAKASAPVVRQVQRMVERLTVLHQQAESSK